MHTLCSVSYSSRANGRSGQSAIEGLRGTDKLCSPRLPCSARSGGRHTGRFSSALLSPPPPPLACALLGRTTPRQDSTDTTSGQTKPAWACSSARLGAVPSFPVMGACMRSLLVSAVCGCVDLHVALTDQLFVRSLIDYRSGSRL